MSTFGDNFSNEQSKDIYPLNDNNTITATTSMANEAHDTSHSKLNMLVKKLWPYSKKSNSTSGLLRNKNLSSKLSNNSFILLEDGSSNSTDRKEKSKSLLANSNSSSHIYNSFHQHMFSSSQHHIHHYAPFQRTITQKFFSSRSMVNYQSRNIKMMSLTIIIVSCIFILLTLPIMLFIGSIFQFKLLLYNKQFTYIN